MSSVSSGSYISDSVYSDDYASEESSVASETAQPSSPKLIENAQNERVKKVRQEVQGEAEKALDSLALRKLDVSRVQKIVSDTHWKYICSLDPEAQGQEIIKRIITAYNNNAGNKLPFSELEYNQQIYEQKWDPHPHFYLVTYYRQIIIEVSKLASFHLSIGAKIDLSKKSTEYILFFFRILNNSEMEIFALATGDGWLAVERFTDWNFSKQIAKRYMKPHVNYIEFTPLVGNSSNTKKPFKKPELLPRTKYYNKLITVLESTVRPNASLFALKAFQNKNGQPLDLKILVRSGYVKFGKQLHMFEYPSLLDLLSKISRALPTFCVKLDSTKQVTGHSTEHEVDDPNLKHWEDISLVSFEKTHALEEALKTEIWRSFQQEGTCALDFYHRRTGDYYQATQYELKMKGKRKPIAKWHRPYTASEMIAMVKKKCPDLEDCEDAISLFKELDQLQISIKTKNKIPPAPFLSCFSGEIRLANEGSFFKMAGKWYCVSTDLVSWVEDEFRQLVSQHLITKKEKGHLPHTWEDKRKNEREYNQSYGDLGDYLVCDRICPRGIELCDLLRYDAETETFYFYHVKKGLGQKTRDACSQIRNAAAQILPALNPKVKESILDEFIDMIETQYGSFALCGSKEEFCSLIKEKKIIFVYAFVDDTKTERLLFRETKLQTRFSRDDFAGYHDEDKVHRSLQRNNFLNEDGYLTSKFLCITKEEFIEVLQNDHLSHDVAEAIYKLLRTGVSHFKSTIARLELLNLQKYFKDKKNVEFKICQIRRNEKSSEEDVEPDALLLSKLQEVNLVQVLEGEYFLLDGEYYVVDKTLADGTCALHALLGSSHKGVFQALRGPKAVREDFSKKLKEALQNNHPDVTPLFRNHLKSQLKEYIASKDNNCWIAEEPVADISLKVIRKKERIESDINDFRNDRFEAFKVFYATSRELIDDLPQEAESDPIEYFESHPHSFTLFCNNLLNRIPATEAEEIRAVDAKIEQCQNALLTLEDEFVDHPIVREAYFTEISDENYWFESNELGLAAWLYEKHVVICHMQNRSITKANEYNPQVVDKMVLYQEQAGSLAHFSHCTKTNIRVNDQPPPVDAGKRPREEPQSEMQSGNAVQEVDEEAQSDEVYFQSSKKIKRNAAIVL